MKYIRSDRTPHPTRFALAHQRANRMHKMVVQFVNESMQTGNINIKLLERTLRQSFDLTDVLINIQREFYETSNNSGRNGSVPLS